jgi:L-alanine-DL-glutamate epimerase-like enolase superfamily enzyme
LLLREPLMSAAGEYHLPTGNGLGIEIDEQQLQTLQR